VTVKAAKVEPGDTFFIDPSWKGGVCHLWVVLTVHVPDFAYEEHAVIVNITSMTKRGDKTCVLQPGEKDGHEFVTQESYVFYGGIQEVEVASLLALGAGARRTKASAEFLSRLRRGLHKSPFTRRGFKASVPQT